MPWIRVATAPDQLTAELWCELLRNAGIPAMLEPRDIASYLGVSGMPCGLLVDAARVEEALMLLEAVEPEEHRGPGVEPEPGREA